MNPKEYFSELCNHLLKNPQKILIQTFKTWLIFPLIIFVVYSFYLVIFGITEDGILKLFLLSVNASLDWWLAPFINFWKVVAEFIFAFLIVLNYYAIKGD